MVFDKIIITFQTPVSDFTRRPVGRTCGRILEVPDNYEEFVHLREEFNKILESDIWVTDME